MSNPGPFLLVKKDKMTNNDLLNTTQKTQDPITQAPIKTGDELMCLGRVGRSLFVLLYFHIISQSAIALGGHRGCDRMVVGLQLPMQSVPITTDAVSSNIDQGELYNIM
jgi:hypothetical protein